MALRPVYSIQIMSLAPALTINTEVVPTGSRIIVRDIDVVEVGGIANAVIVVRNAAAGLLWAVDRGAATGNFVAQWRGRQVFNPGDSIVVQVVSGTWDIQMSGYELTVV